MAQNWFYEVCQCRKVLIFLQFILVGPWNVTWTSANLWRFLQIKNYKLKERKTILSQTNVKKINADEMLRIKSVSSAKREERNKCFFGYKIVTKKARKMAPFSTFIIILMTWIHNTYFESIICSLLSAKCFQTWYCVNMYRRFATPAMNKSQP